jgi:hypothetical protein
MDSEDLTLVVHTLVQNEVGLFLLLNFCLSLYAMTALVTTVVFLGRLSSRESAKLTERLVKYVVFKVLFVGAVVGPDVVELAVWMLWFGIVGRGEPAAAGCGTLELLLLLWHPCLPASCRPNSFCRPTLASRFSSFLAAWQAI